MEEGTQIANVLFVPLYPGSVPASALHLLSTKGKCQIITIVLDRLNMTDVFIIVKLLSRSAFKAVILLTGEKT